MSKVTVEIENKTRNEHMLTGTDRTTSYSIPVGKRTLELDTGEFKNIVPALVKLENVKERGEKLYDINVDDGGGVYA